MSDQLVDSGSGGRGAQRKNRQGVYEPQELTGSAVLSKLAARVAPPSVKHHLAEREAERERRDRAWQDEQAARLKQQREQLAAGKFVRCACCGGPIETEPEAVEKHGTLVHVGDCEQEWGSELDAEEAA